MGNAAASAGGHPQSAPAAPRTAQYRYGVSAWGAKGCSGPRLPPVSPLCLEPVISRSAPRPPAATSEPRPE